MRIIHGTIEIANQMFTMVQGLRRIGLDARTINYYPSYLQYESDEVINIKAFRDANLANKALKELASRIIPAYDVFHYHFGTSLLLDYSDLPLLKEQNKKVLMHHWGSDVRRYSLAVRLNPYVKVKSMNENTIRNRLDRLSKYIETCVVCDEELYEYVKEYYRKVVVFPQVIDIQQYSAENNHQNGRLTIVHAPTSPGIKGTGYILKAVEELGKEHDFEFRLVKGMSHEEARKIYLNADIVIDQLLIGSYGLVSIENMALGKPVVCWISEFMKGKYPRELPIISANPDNIKEVIAYLLSNRDSLHEIGLKSRAYAEKYHDINKFSHKLLELYQSL